VRQYRRLYAPIGIVAAALAANAISVYLEYGWWAMSADICGATCLAVAVFAVRLSAADYRRAERAITTAENALDLVRQSGINTDVLLGVVRDIVYSAPFLENEAADVLFGLIVARTCDVDAAAPPVVELAEEDQVGP